VLLGVDLSGRTRRTGESKKNPQSLQSLSKGIQVRVGCPYVFKLNEMCYDSESCSYHLIPACYEISCYM